MLLSLNVVHLILCHPLDKQILHILIFLCFCSLISLLYYHFAKHFSLCFASHACQEHIFSVFSLYRLISSLLIVYLVQKKSNSRSTHRNRISFKIFFTFHFNKCLFEHLACLFRKWLYFCSNCLEFGYIIHFSVLLFRNC